MLVSLVIALASTHVLIKKSLGSSIASPTHMTYPTFQPNSFQNSQSRSRLRAASATLPLGLDLGPQRSYSSSQQGIRSATSPHRHATVTSAPYSTGFSTAPLTTSSDYSLPRTSGYPARSHDYSVSHMSAPIAAPNDFSQAFQASLNSGPSTRTPMRDAFGGGGPLEGGGDRSNEEYGGPGGELKRKRSFTMPQGGPGP